MSETSDRIRKSFKINDDKRDKGLNTPDGIQRYDNILYGNDSQWQILDLYRPLGNPDAILPVIVSVHGGGWVYGDKERYQYYAMDLAERGFAVVNFTYRLAPEFKYPSPLEDINLVFEWVLKNSDRYRLDLSNIFAVGDSAGAHTLALYCCICCNTEYAREYLFKVPSNLRIKAVALNCGVAKITDKEEGDETTLRLMKDYLPGRNFEKELYLNSPVYHIREDFPPVYLMSSTGDFLKEQMLFFAEQFMKYNVSFTAKYYGNKNHKPEHVFHCDIRTTDAKKCNDDECAFFKELITD